MTPEEIELYKLQMEKMKKGFEKKLSQENLEKLKIQKQIREQQRKDRGLPEGLELLATGGRAGFRVGKKVIEKIVKPKKTLKSIEETGMIDISDPDIAAEFAKYMKQMDPNLDAKMQQIADDINQRIELRNLKKRKRS